jgi:hypothetical protein
VRRGAVRGAATIAAGLLILAGCFGTRDPVAPPVITCQTFVQANPENVLSNYELAWDCGAAGAAVILDVLDDGFVLVLDPLDALETGFQSLSAAQVERAHGILVSAPADSFHFEFTRVTPIISQGTAEYQDMPYSLEVLTGVSPDSLSLALLVTGRTTLRLAQDPVTTLWRMTRWEDQAGGVGSETVGRYYADNAIAP